MILFFGNYMTGKNTYVSHLEDVPTFPRRLRRGGVPRVRGTSYSNRLEILRVNLKRQCRNYSIVDKWRCLHLLGFEHFVRPLVFLSVVFYICIYDFGTKFSPATKITNILDENHRQNLTTFSIGRFYTERNYVPHNHMHIHPF